VIGRLEADPDISAAGFVGSIGHGDADDWSDVDLVIVVPDDQAGRYADAAGLALLGQYRGAAPAESLSATRRYLDLVADVL
jgi:predicted nucleotidyltransferase